MRSNADILRQAELMCEGVYSSSHTVGEIFRQYHSYTGSREFYRLLVRFLDSNIERMAMLTDILDQRGLSPKMEEPMTRAKSKTWETLEDVSAYCKKAFHEDLWHDRNTFPVIPIVPRRKRLDSLP